MKVKEVTVARRRLLALGLVSLVVLCACSGLTAARGDCEFMLQSEREQCLRANESSRQAVKARKESSEAKQASGASSPSDSVKP